MVLHQAMVREETSWLMGYNASLTTPGHKMTYKHPHRAQNRISPNGQTVTTRGNFKLCMFEADRRGGQNFPLLHTKPCRRGDWGLGVAVLYNVKVNMVDDSKDKYGS